jgi:hypothetical protein
LAVADWVRGEAAWIAGNTPETMIKSSVKISLTSGALGMYDSSIWNTGQVAESRGPD